VFYSWLLFSYGVSQPLLPAYSVVHRFERTGSSSHPVIVSASPVTITSYKIPDIVTDIAIIILPLSKIAQLPIVDPVACSVGHFHDRHIVSQFILGLLRIEAVV
jgi:hypothetical protein